MPRAPVSARLHHAAPVTCVLTCSWLLLLVHAALAQKPAKPASPRAMRTGPERHHILRQPAGPTIRTTTDQGKAINGGLPQNCSLDSHLRKARKGHLPLTSPPRTSTAWPVIDWEYWRPQWGRNWHKKGHLPQEVTGTLQLGTKHPSPRASGAFYLYPDCHNYNHHERNYTGSCPLLESLRNDELLWMWNSSTALFPSIAIRKSHANAVSNLHFSQYRVLESLRIASLTALDYDLPTFVYTRLGYRDEAMAFLTTKDLIHTIGESAALGAAGFVIWGDLNLTSSRHNCSRVKSFLGSRLGQYITNVTRAAEVCSDFLCQSNGRCARRDSRASHYLHLSSDSYRIEPSGDGEFAVTGWHSQRELLLLANRFRCHCYQGYGGERCDSLETPEETKSAALRTGNSVVSVVLILILNFII
ncbi:hypothetical protein SKAU_G00024610 [Synaphobranchus kaupii]|uniref:Hyaluronidase n=1 Tax=Synaphobranchus kaupii TaxID=118154 RepID=A0A9Q1GDH1_SYNKA|nr:hypothetical protein SKAU_G00024610 [Synaphobranchus kaupii]